MLDINNLKHLKTVHTSNHQTISIVSDDDGKKYIKRIIEGDKREIFKVLKTIHHVSIPCIYNIEFDGNTTVYEQYFEGLPLSDTEKAYSKKEILNISKQLLSAMETLHCSNIIHRDIKPENILIDKCGSIMLIDYDISRIFRSEMRQDTEQKGTFGYAPIEQYGILPTDFKTDIYAFGVTLKELLENSGIKKWYLHKIADKCRRLDPNLRYKNVAEIKRAVSVSHTHFFVCCITVLLLILVCFMLIFRNNSSSNDSIGSPIEHQAKTPSPEITHEDEPQKTTENKPFLENDIEYEQYIRFIELENSDDFAMYANLKDFEYASIFSFDQMIDYIPFMADISVNGKVLLGENHATPASFDTTLNDGVFSVNLSDPHGHTFSHEFSLDGIDFSVLYPDERRVNAEIFCLDLDDDGIEEFVIGICDCSMIIYNDTIFVNENLSVGYAIKYDEKNGFVLCDGKMISENSSFYLTEHNSLVHLPGNAINTDGAFGFKLEGNQISPFY